MPLSMIVRRSGWMSDGGPVSQTEGLEHGPVLSHGPLSGLRPLTRLFQFPVQRQRLLFVALWPTANATISGDLGRPLPFGVFGHVWKCMKDTWASDLLNLMGQGMDLRMARPPDLPSYHAFLSSLSTFQSAQTPDNTKVWPLLRRIRRAPAT